MLFKKKACCNGASEQGESKIEEKGIYVLGSGCAKCNSLDIIHNEEKCACVLLEKLDLTQSGLSYHMRILSEAGIVNFRQDGKWTHYSINEKGIQEAKKILDDYL